MNHPYFPADKRRRSLRRSSQLLPLEQRFMFDGAVADAAHAAQAHEIPQAPPAVTVRAAEPAKDGGKKEVAIVDTSLAGYKTLEAGVRAGVGIVEFDGSKDGLAQIAQWAATQSNYDAIHILSHGAQGVVDLGTMHLSESALTSASTQQELAQLGKALASEGDLLLYGCDVGAGTQGASLLDGLARATGADVAASTDATGAAAKGGNWALETHAGKIDTRALGISDYQDLLTVVTITSSDANYTNYFFTKSVGGVTFTFTGDPAAGLGMDNSISGQEGLFAYDTNTANGIKLTITAQSGYMFDLSGLDVGTFASGITIQYTDAGGNPGSVSPSVAAGSWQTVSGLGSTVKNVVSIVISANDFTELQNFNFINITTIAPATVVNSASLSSDTGASNSDFITNTASQTISGTLSSVLGTGEKVQVSYNNGSTWSDATSYTVGSSSWSTTTTLSGSNTFRARVTNSFASSTAYSHTYTLDTTAPATTFSNAALSSDTGASNTDFITSSASQTISATLSGALGAGDVLKGSLDGGSTWTDITAKVSGTTLTWNGATLGSGSNTLMLKVTDAAGNDSSAYSRSYTLDTTAPSTTISSAAFSNDSGTSGSDFITNVAAQTVSGTLSANLQSGETVYVSMDNGSTWTAATATVGTNTWSLSGVTLTGSNTMRIKVSDTAGNDGTVRTQAYVYDTTAPATTFSGLAFSNDSGVAGDFITNSSSQTISATLSGSLAAGDILYGSLDGGATWSDITSNVSGTALSWTGVTLTGSNTLQLKVVDAAGNQGTAGSQAYVLDTSAPAAPSTPVLTSDSGISSSDLVTNVNTPTFTGTAESGSTVKIYDGATLLGSVTATGGAWSYTSATLGEGSHNITATATDVAGNVSSSSSAIAVTVDTTAPVVNSVSVPANGTYYTGNALDFTVNFSEAVYVDSSGGTPRIALVIGATTRYASYVSGSGTSALVFRYSVVNGDSDGDGITVGALASNGGTLSDQAGNIGVNTLNSVGSTAAVLVDGSQPAVTNVSSSTANGAYAAGSTITITVDFSGTVNVDTTGGTPTMALNSGGTATYSSGSGTSTLTFSYTVGAGENSADLDYSSSGALSLNGATISGPGGISQSASLTLAAPGAAGSLGANKNIDIDTTAPAITGSTASFSADTGTSSTDLITNVATQSISGTLTGALSAGDSVQVSLDNGASWTTATAAGSSWSFAAPVTLTGSNTLQVRVVDIAGNIGSAASYAYVLDTTAPTTTFSNAALSSDTGASNTDFITSSASQTISATLSGALGAGDVLKGSLDGGSTWTDITAKVSGTTLTWNGATLGSGSNTLMLKVTDAAGNDSSAYSRSYTLDTTAPATTISSVAFSNDSGTSGSDFITSVAAQTVSGTLSANLQSGETVYVSMDNGSTWTAATATVGTNTWSLSGVTLTGSNTMRIKVSDTAGNDGTVRTQAYVYDTTAAGDFITNTASQTISATLSGSLAAGDILYGSLDGGATWSDITSNVSGTALSWTGVTLTGSNTLQLRVVDAAGNQGTAGSQAYVLDTSAPAAPSTPVLTSDSGISSSDLVTNVNTPTFTGTAESGSTVKIYDGATLLGSVTAIGGAWSYTSTTLGEGSHNITATATDVAGNVSSSSSAIAVTVDTTAPVVNSVSVPANGTYYTGNALDFTVNFSEAVYVDSSGGTPRIALVIGATTRYASYVSGSGTSALVFRYSVVNGDSDGDGITVGALASNGGTLSDQAGNIGANTLNSVGSTAAVLVDGSQPAVTNVSSSTANGAYAAGSTITITVDFSGTVNVDTTGGTPAIALNSGGTATYSSGSGSSTLTFSYTVGAGENSADLDYSSTGALSLNGATISGPGGISQSASLTLAAPGAAGSLGANKNIDIDTTAPAITGSTASFSADTGTSSTDLITNVATQSISGTLTGALSAGDSVQVSLDNGASWTTATAASSSWSLAAPVTLTGSNTLQVRVVDLAGNIGSAASYAYVLDTMAPTTTFSNAALSSDTGASNTDFITSSANQTISATLSGALGAGDVLKGSLDGGSTWTDITAKVSGTTLTWNGATLGSGSNTLMLKLTDAAGNDSSAYSRSYTLDTTAPATTISSVAFSNDSGTSGSDFITNVAAQTVSGTLSANLQSGETVYVSLDNGATWSAATATVGTNTWSLSGVTLTGSNTMRIKVSDTAGNDGTVRTQAYVYDTTAPATTFSGLALSNDSGVAGDFITNTASQTISATLSGALGAGDALMGSLDGGSTWTDITAKLSGATLTWNGATLGSGSNTLMLKVTDAAGNDSSAFSRSYTLDTTAPATTVSSAALSSDSGTSGNDFITNVAAQTVSGTLSANLSAGETVYVSLDNGTSWQAATAAVGQNTWSLGGQTLSGSNTLLVKVSDIAGNDSAIHAQAYVFDTTPPAAPSADTLLSSTPTPVLSGSATLANGETLTVTVGGAKYAVSAIDGHWTLDLSSATPVSGSLALAPNASYDIIATATDTAGNTSSGTGLLTISPTPLVTGFQLSADSGTSNSDFITNIAAQTVSGTLSAPLANGQTVEVSVDGGATWSPATASGNTWTANVTLSGSNNLVARVASVSGSSTPLQHAYILDTTAPTTVPTLVSLNTNGNIAGSLSAPLAAGESLFASLDGGSTWTSVTTTGQAWSLASNGAPSVQVAVRDAAGNSGAALVINSTLPPAIPLPPTPILPVTPTVTPSAIVPGGVDQQGPGHPNIAAPLVLPLTSAGGDIATGWPGAAPKPMLDILPATVSLRALQSFDPGRPVTALSDIQGSTGVTFQVATVPDLPGGDVLVAYQPIPDVNSASGQRISVQVANDAFAQSNKTASVALSAQLADGRPLPAWLQFDGRTGRFEGTPPLAFEGTLSFRVTARDSKGHIATQVFKIVVSKDGQAGKRSEWQVEPAGRTSLGEQLRAARNAGAARLGVPSA